MSEMGGKLRAAVEAMPDETVEERAARYERALRASGEWTLTGADFGTVVHDGPCVEVEEG